MRYRKLGRTNLNISEIAFGGGRSGGLLIDATENEKEKALEIAKKEGINWIDTAPQYGNGASEEALGHHLPNFQDHFQISTKVRIEKSSNTPIREQIRKSFSGSQKRLGLEHITLLQLHNRIANDDDPRSLTVADVLGPRGVAEALEEIKNEGLVRFIGITALGDNIPSIEVIKSGRFDTAQIYYNMLNPSASRETMPSAWRGYDATGLFNACNEQNIGILAIRIFAAGYLASQQKTGRESILTTGTSSEEETRMANIIFREFQRSYGPISQLAVRFCLSNPTISSVIIGSAEPSHVAEAISAMETGPLPRHFFERLEELYQTNFLQEI